MTIVPRLFAASFVLLLASCSSSDLEPAWQQIQVGNLENARIVVDAEILVEPKSVESIALLGVVELLEQDQVSAREQFKRARVLGGKEGSTAVYDALFRLVHDEQISPATSTVSTALTALQLMWEADPVHFDADVSDNAQRAAFQYLRDASQAAQKSTSRRMRIDRSGDVFTTSSRFAAQFVSFVLADLPQTMEQCRCDLTPALGIAQKVSPSSRENVARVALALAANDALVAYQREFIEIASSILPSDDPELAALAADALGVDFYPELERQIAAYVAELAEVEATFPAMTHMLVFELVAEPNACTENPMLMRQFDRLSWSIANNSTVSNTLALPDLIRGNVAAWDSGSKWRRIARNIYVLRQALQSVETDQGFMDADCSNMPLYVFLNDTRYSTIAATLETVRNVARDLGLRVEMAGNSPFAPLWQEHSGAFRAVDIENAWLQKLKAAIHGNSKEVPANVVDQILEILEGEMGERALLSSDTLFITVGDPVAQEPSGEQLRQLMRVSDEVFVMDGVVRATIRSLVTPNMRFMEVVDGGFAGGNIVPANVDLANGNAGLDPKVVARILANAQIAHWGVHYVSTNGSFLITADVEGGARLATQLRSIRERHSSQAMEIKIAGFPLLRAIIQDNLKEAFGS